MKSYILEKISKIDENLVKHPGVNMNNVFISIDKTLADNVFQIHVGPRFIFIRAENEAMLFYGSLDFLQETSRREILITRTQTMDQEHDKVLVDLGQDFYSKENFINLIEKMALNKMKTLQIKIFGNAYYGIESKKFPHLSSKLHLSIKEVSEILEYAREYYIEVQPMFNTFAHLGSILNPYPEYQLKGHDAMLDTSKEEAKNYIKELLDELCAIFDLSSCFHLGNYDGPLFVSSQTSSEPASSSQGYLEFTKDIASYLNAKGKKVQMSGSLQEGQAEHELLNTIELKQESSWKQIENNVLSTQSSLKIN